MTTNLRSQLVKWLEEDGHAGCAEMLALSNPSEPAFVATVARVAAEHAELDAHYDDPMSIALPDQLRAFALELDNGIPLSP